MIWRRRSLVTLTLIGLAVRSLAAVYGGGSGTKEDPYQIGTPEHLISLGQTPEDYDTCFVLTADIDLEVYTFDRAVIAPDVNDLADRFQGEAFTGSVDGDGHDIVGLTILGGHYTGLFGKVGDADLFGYIQNAEDRTAGVEEPPAGREHKMKKGQP